MAVSFFHEPISFRASRGHPGSLPRGLPGGFLGSFLGASVHGTRWYYKLGSLQGVPQETPRKPGKEIGSRKKVIGNLKKVGFSRSKWKTSPLILVYFLLSCEITRPFIFLIHFGLCNLKNLVKIRKKLETDSQNLRMG